MKRSEIVFEAIGKSRERISSNSKDSLPDGVMDGAELIDGCFEGDSEGCSVGLREGDSKKE